MIVVPARIQAAPEREPLVRSTVVLSKSEVFLVQLDDGVEASVGYTLPVRFKQGLLVKAINVDSAACQWMHAAEEATVQCRFAEAACPVVEGIHHQGSDRLLTKPAAIKEDSKTSIAEWSFASPCSIRHCQ